MRILSLNDGKGVLVVGEHLLIEFLPRPQSRELYLDVVCSRQLYHPPCEVYNLHGLAHLEDKYLTALAACAGFEDELAGFRNEHEVADDVRVGNRYRTTVAYLLLEEWDDGTVAAKDIAEACRHKLSVAAVPFLRVFQREPAVQALAVYLTYALGTSHDI